MHWAPVVSIVHTFFFYWKVPLQANLFSGFQMGPFIFFKSRKSFHVCFHTRLKTIYSVQYQNSHCSASRPYVPPTQILLDALLLAEASSRLPGGIRKQLVGRFSYFRWCAKNTGRHTFCTATGSVCVSVSKGCDLLKASLVYFPYRFLQ